MACQCLSPRTNAHVGRHEWFARLIVKENASTGASMELWLGPLSPPLHPPTPPPSQLHTVHLPQCTCDWTSQHWRIAAVQAQNSKQSTLLFGRQYIPELTLYELVAVPSCDSYGRCFQPSHPCRLFKSFHTKALDSTGLTLAKRQHASMLQADSSSFSAKSKDPQMASWTSLGS